MMLLYRVAKKLAHFCIPRVKYWPIFNFFHFQNQKNICNSTITEDPTTPQMWPYSLLCEMSMY